MKSKSISGFTRIWLVAVLSVVGVVGFIWLNREESLGPIDGHDLPAMDTGRVQPDDRAPDFRLSSFAGEVVSLSDFRGKRDVVLVFYRGHW